MLTNVLKFWKHSWCPSLYTGAGRDRRYILCQVGKQCKESESQRERVRLGVTSAAGIWCPCKTSSVVHQPTKYLVRVVELCGTCIWSPAKIRALKKIPAWLTVCKGSSPSKPYNYWILLLNIGNCQCVANSRHFILVSLLVKHCIIFSKLHICFACKILIWKVLLN